MNALHLSAILLIASSVAMVVGTVLLPQEIYAVEGPRTLSSRPDPNRATEAIEQNRTRYNIAQIVNVLSVVLLVGGFGVLAWHLRGTENAWIPLLGTAVLAVGTIAGVIFLFRQTTDTFNSYSGAYSAFENAAYWLWLVGTVLMGIGFLQAGLPSWLGYLTAGASLLYGVFFLVTGAGFMAPFLIGFLALVIGIVLLRQ